MATQQTSEQNPQAVRREFRHLFWWMAGAHPDMLGRLANPAQMFYTALGMVFALNYGLLLAAWITVGIHYFGKVGIVVPGILAPSLFLALDRLIAMRPRRLTGEFRAYDQLNENPRPSELFGRIAMALTLCAATTFTFQLDQAASQIAERAAIRANKANQHLRAQYEKRIADEYDARARQINTAEKLLQAEYDTKKNEYELANAALNEADAKLQAALTEAASEAGGLGRRIIGEGPRFRAQTQIARLQQDAVSAESARIAQLESALRKSGDKLNLVKADATRAAAEKSLRMQEVAGKMIDDPDYVQPLHGMYADATMFLQLFSDPDQGPGVWIFSAIMGGCLLTFELGALLALLLLPSTSYDLRKFIVNRLEASKMVAAAEIELINHNASLPPVRIVPTQRPLAASQPAAAAPNSGNAP